MASSAFLYALLSVLVVSLISLAGLATFSIKVEKLRKVLLYLVSFAAGALFGDVFLHLLPELTEGIGFTIQSSFIILGGISFSFVIEKFVHWRHCHLPTTSAHPHPVATMNLVGDGVHNFIDGLIIGASYLVSLPVGIATTVAVALHEIPQEIGDFGILLHGGYSRGKALFMNFVLALTAILGVIIAIFIGSRIDGLITLLIPFAAGTFIYIASSDLIPELHKEVSVAKSFMQLVFFFAGIGLMLLLLAV